MKDKLKIVFFGAGAIGSSVGAWLASHYDEVYFLDQGELAQTLREKGITYYPGKKPNDKKNMKVKVISDLSEVPDADVIAVAVKTYSLEAVSRIIKDKMGDRPIIIGMQNGTDNQKILSRYFSKVIYCVICYNAWLDAPGEVGYEKQGPLLFGTINNELMDEMKQVAKVFNLGVKTVVVDHLQDAVHSKLIYNLNNSLSTLLGHKFRPIPDRKLFQKLISNTTYEGMKIVKAAGFRECRIGDYPSWLLLAASVRLPYFITHPLFEMNVKKMVVLSMAQDIIQRGGRDSEIETLTGYILSLADKYGVQAPYNRAVYELCKVEFAKPKFTPLDAEVIWKKVQEYMVQ